MEVHNIGIQLQEVNIYRLVRETVKLFFPKAIEIGITIEIEETNVEKTLNADENAIRQVIFQVMSRALKTTAQGGTIYITISLFEDTKAVIEISNVDSKSTEDDIQILRKIIDSPDSCNNSMLLGNHGILLAKKLTKLHGGRLLASARNDSQGITLICQIEWPNSVTS
jgi:signal transduction histidine kinase